MQFFEGCLAQVLESIQVDVSFAVVMIGFEEVDTLLDLQQNFLQLSRLLNCPVVIQDICALFCIFVMLLMFLNLADDTGKYVFTVENHHAGLLEVTRTCHHYCLIDLYLS